MTGRDGDTIQVDLEWDDDSAEVERLRAERDAAVAALNRVRRLCDVVETRMMATAKPSEIRAAIAAADVPDAAAAGETG